MPNTTYLIIGSSRGIGRGLVSIFHTTVIAAVRDTASEHSQSLLSLPGPESQLILVKLDSASPTDVQQGVTTLHSKHSIESINIMIANAGISFAKEYVPVHDISINTLHEYIHLNGLGPVYLYQAVYSRLKKGQRRCFLVLKARQGVLRAVEKRSYPCAVDGPSKAVLHWIIREMHFAGEIKGVMSFVVDLGRVDFVLSPLQVVLLRRSTQV
ncbi:hypothetical protein BDW75DRAFT_211192 [Aspergillus navahoensis]